MQDQSRCPEDSPPGNDIAVTIVPQKNRFTKQLHQVLVPADDVHLLPRFSPGNHGGEIVIRFKNRAGKGRDTEHLGYLPAAFQLEGQILVRQSPVGFVIWVKVVTKARTEALIERCCDIKGFFLQKQFQQKSRKTINCFSRFTILALPARCQGKIASENIDRAVDSEKWLGHDEKRPL